MTFVDIKSSKLKLFIDFRFMLGLSGVPSAIMLFGLFFMPESPRWLASEGRIDQARKVLKRIRDSDDVEEEIEEILLSKQREHLAINDETNCGIFWHIWKTPSVRKALLVGCGLQAFQQLSGINTVM